MSEYEPSKQKQEDQKRDILKLCGKFQSGDRLDGDLPMEERTEPLPPVPEWTTVTSTHMTINVRIKATRNIFKPKKRGGTPDKVAGKFLDTHKDYTISD